MRSGVYASAAVLGGVLLSGPLAVVLVEATHPQPAWSGGEAFARAYHPIQSVPYLGGIVLVLALVMLIAAIHAGAPAALRVRTGAAQVLTAVFATLIFLNYVVQTSYVPALARDRTPADDAILAMLSMVNPRSLAWAVEMWGWAFLGLATWLVAPTFAGSRLEDATRRAFIANGPVSIAGALLTALWPGWPMSLAGLILFAGWNVLLAAMAVLALLGFRRRQLTAAARPGGTPWP
jgi:hypothetical protein